MVKEATTTKEEKKFRAKYAQFVQQAGLLLELPNNTICTALVYFHRYHASINYTKGDAYVRNRRPAQCQLARVAAHLSSVFVPGVESRREQPPCARSALARVAPCDFDASTDILNVCYRLQHPNDPPLEVSEVRLSCCCLQFDGVIARITGR